MIDELRCIYCGMCEQACPVDAIELTTLGDLTGLSRDEFGSKDLGGNFQFTSHAGLNWDFAEHFRVGYRFQHMSNAGLREPNPGLNLHLFAVSYLF